LLSALRPIFHISAHVRHASSSISCFSMQSLAYFTSYLSDIVPMAQEFYLLTFFCLGFLMFRSESVRSFFNSGKQTQAVKHNGSLRSLSRLRENFKQRRYEQVLEDWAYLDKYTSEALTLVVTSLLALGRPDDVGVLIAKTVANLPDLKRTIHEIVAAVANPSCEVRRQHVIIALRDICDQALDCLDQEAVRQMIVALSNANDEQRVARLLGELASQKEPASAKELGSVVHGFLACKNLDASFGYLRQMLASDACQESSRDLIIEVVKASTEADMNDDSTPGDERPRAWEALDTLEGFSIPNEAAALFLEWSARQTPVDVAMATRIEQLLRNSGKLPSSAYDALVRVHATSAGDQTKAFAFFDELIAIADDSTPSERSLVGMISGCVEAKNGALAAHIFKWARKQGRCTTAVFSVTLKVLAASKRNEDICAIYESASSNERMALDEGICGQIIQAATQAGRSELARNVFSRTKHPNAQNYMSLMRACGQEGKVDKALELLRELQSHGEVDTVTYNCALDVCVSAGSDSAAAAIFQEMKAAHRTDVVSYNIMLKQCMSEHGSSSTIDEVLEDMRKDGLKPNTSTYNSLIGAALSGGDFTKAWKIIDQMEAAGQNVDAYTLSILFKGYKQERRTMDSSSVGRVLSLVKTHSVKVDEVLVNVALEACLALRDLGRLKDALQTFTRSGWSGQKQCSMHTYGVLIKAHGQTHNLNEAWRLWQEVTVEKRMEASEQLYGQMLDVLVGSDCLEDALQLFKEMKATHKDSLNSQGFSVAYAMIIRGFAQRKDCARALQCYEEMKLHGTKVSLVVLNTLIDACSRVGDMVAATKIFQEMSETQCVPDVITYSTLIKGHCVNDDLDRALQLFSLMQKKGIRPDAIVFNSLLDGCAKRQMPVLCEQVISDMESAGVVPSNHSASILIKLYGRCKDLDAAFRVINEMPQKYGFKPNNAVYTCLMSACIANGRLDQAMELRVRMLKEGVCPDEKTFSTLLRGALRAGSVEQCVLLVNSALDQKGVRSVRNLLDNELVKSVLILIQRRNLWQAHGQELLDRLRDVGMSVQIPEISKASYNEQQRGQRNHGKNGNRNFGSGQCFKREMNASSDVKPLQRRHATCS